MSTSPSLLPHTELDPPPNVSAPSVDSSESDFAEHPQFILFGDSITQFGTLTLQAYLQTQYIRRLDIINRGLSGFTAPMGFRALQKFLPCTTARSTWPNVTLVTIFFGANDACVPGEDQHVELQTYIDTIRKVIEYPVFSCKNSRKTGVILITPPPVNENQFERVPSGQFQRRAGVTSQYARAAKKLGHACGIPVLDLWTIFMRKVGWERSMGYACCCEHIPCRTSDYSAGERLQEEHIPGCIDSPTSLPSSDYQLSDFLTDGLHLTKLGYDVLFWELLKLIKHDLPHCAPEALPFVLPEWRDALKMPSYSAHGLPTSGDASYAPLV